MKNIIDFIKIKFIYMSPKNSIYFHKFLNDMSSTFLISRNNDNHELFEFEPNGCQISELFNSNFIGKYNIEKTISTAVYDLIIYGKSYIQISPEYSKNSNNNVEIHKKEITSLSLNVLEGYIKNIKGNRITFCYTNLDELKIDSNFLIKYDLKELGFNKRYFFNILNKLAKCDSLSASNKMVINKTKGYDFAVHQRKKSIKELKIIKDVGWTFGDMGLSESYLLYKKIKEDKLRILLTNYILKKLNDGLKMILSNSCGEIILNCKNIDYKNVWNQYSKGDIDARGLANILY